jgi:hypothetical protein
MSTIEKIPNVSDMLDGLKKNQRCSDSKEILPPSEEVLEPPSEEVIEPLTEETPDEITHSFDPCEADPEETAPLIQTSAESWFTPTSESRFSAYGQVVINQAKADGRLVEFASKMPPPKKREKMLKPNTRVNNTDTWSKYVFREANGINDWKLGNEWKSFSGEMASFKGAGMGKSKKKDVLQTKQKKYESLIYKPKPLSNGDFEEGVEILNWLKLNQHIDENTYNLGIMELGG